MSALGDQSAQQWIMRKSLPWLGLTLLESTTTAMAAARIAFGPPSLSAFPLLWFFGAAGLFLVYLGIALTTTKSLLARGYPAYRWCSRLLIISTVPFLISSLLILALLQLRPELGSRVLSFVSPIQPFPIAAVALSFFGVFLLKLLLASFPFPSGGALRFTGIVVAADLSIPALMLMIGVLQASVFLVPIGNAFLRFWAISDATALGIPYPVTLTEPQPMAAGSPPYVYDLPLFPLMLRAAFALLGHNSAAAYLPATLWNALFPLSVYLLIKEATRSRVTAVIFTALVSLFPYLRFWVLNLPDPDPFLLTSACFAGYFYLRALAAPERSSWWIAAGIAGGVLSLARPEGILYSGFFGLGILLSRPRIKQFALYLISLCLFLGPMMAAWMANFGFPWPQNYNRTLRLDYPLENYGILNGNGALEFYWKGLGLDAERALALLFLFLFAVVLGTILMAVKDRRLLAIAIPGIGNTVMIWFANPWIPNTFHFADFFRHASFGIPFLVVTSAYAFQGLYGYLATRTRTTRILAYVCLFLLTAVVVREGDILANPTLTHRSDPSEATQVLTTYTYLSMEDILKHPLTLPPVEYYRDGNVTVAHITSMVWPEDALEFFKPLDMAFDSNARAFGYASAVAFVLGLAIALLVEGTLSSRDTTAQRKSLEQS